MPEEKRTNEQSYLSVPGIELLRNAGLLVHDLRWRWWINGVIFLSPPSDYPTTPVKRERREEEKSGKRVPLLDCIFLFSDFLLSLHVWRFDVSCISFHSRVTASNLKTTIDTKHIKEENSNTEQITTYDYSFRWMYSCKHNPHLWKMFFILKIYLRNFKPIYIYIKKEKESRQYL